MLGRRIDGILVDGKVVRTHQLEIRVALCTHSRYRPPVIESAELPAVSAVCISALAVTSVTVRTGDALCRMDPRLVLHSLLRVAETALFHLRRHNRGSERRYENDEAWELVHQFHATLAP
jgi:hypothetical protein